MPHDQSHIENVAARVPGLARSSSEDSANQTRGANDVQGSCVLVVDVNKWLYETCAQWVHREAFGVRICGDISELMTSSNLFSADVIIVAIEVIGVDPYSPLRQLRNRDRQVPLLACLDNLSPLAAVVAYEAGADGCFSKNEDPVLMEARIRSAVRRSLRCRQCASGANATCSLNFKPPIGHKAATLPIEADSLTRFEEHLLNVLMREIGKTVPRKVIIRELWKDSNVATKRLYEHVSTLRGKLVPLGWTVANDRNEGYRLERAPGGPSSSGTVCE